MVAPMFFRLSTMVSAVSRSSRNEDSVISTSNRVAGKFPHGPDAGPYAEAFRTYTDAGYDHVVLMNAGPDPDGFLDFFAKELGPALRG